jgi:hypothetical protein
MLQTERMMPKREELRRSANSSNPLSSMFASVLWLMRGSVVKVPHHAAYLLVCGLLLAARAC